MRWATALSTEDRFDHAMGEIMSDLERDLDGAPDLVMAHASPHHRVVWDAVPRLLGDRFPSAVQIGCSANGVIGAGREVEDHPAISAVAARLPETRVTGFYLGPEDVPDPGAPSDFWNRRLGAGSGDGRATVILLPDPFSCQAERIVGSLDLGLTGVTTIGGLASGARQTGSNMLYLGGTVFHEGCVGVSLEGGHRIETVVAQGCRPIGEPFIVTDCSGFQITSLDGRRPAEVLHELFESLTPHDQDLLRYSLFLGIVTRANPSRLEPGDFLIRNLAGLDQATGAVTVAARVERGQVVQFHLRDRETSRLDLRAHLEARAVDDSDPPAAALTYSCLGRGIHLYGEPDHDSRLVRELVGDVPIGGFFCNGEIGPVQGRTHIHGYTTVLAMVHPVTHHPTAP